ncbi:type IV pilus assembly protein FimV [Nitrosomonas supralitoralis]|uniref:Uncharacterized protein n=1 Tax=Nitrosomonas supralitoralis TaxID=2116706 RepID=A0A2P7NW20_9PROT|nr:hypothetical protein [Nitrosomonas supralitoralis]PSJ17671.1 hypothetical protein C7H79_07145 [Nitrosomonas supralitoralis]
MVAIIGKLITVILFFLTGTSVSAEVPVSYSESESISSNRIDASRQENTRQGMPWQIRPGEDILQIARLIYPENAAARDTLIRAIIQTNSEHFPDGIYQPIPIGTTIHIPDLRTINAYAKPATQSRQPKSAKDSATRKPQETTTRSIKSESKNHQLSLKLIGQLEQIADSEAIQLNQLTINIASIETHIASLQSLLLSQASIAQEKQVEHVEVIPDTELKPRTDSMIQPENKAHQNIDTVAIAENLILQSIDNSATPNEFTADSIDVALFSDTTFLVGIILTLMVVFMMLRNHKKIKERLAGPVDELFTVERHRYEAVLLHHNDKTTQFADNNSSDPPDLSDQAASAAHTLIEQENPDAAIELLQRQLAINQRDVPTWLMLFELLYKSNNKRDFKKNARRFKRMRKFPDIWQQIQSLGHKLEPNESLYFDELKRKEKFFSDTSESI